MDSPPGASSRLARGMSTAWEGDEPRSTGWTRREWAKLALAAGAASSVLAMGGTVAGQLLPPPAKFQGELRQEIYYTKWPRPTWWDDRQGRPILATDFQEWQGASGVWRGLFVNERWVPGTGLAVLVIRVKYDAPEFQVSTDLVPPRGFSFYHDDPGQRIRIVVFADRCTHLCCPPGWHVITDTVPDRAYRIPPPTYSVYGQDPIFCICHGSQYDPLLLTTNVHPRNGVPYLGATHVHGPTQRALPIVPVRVEGEGLVGGMPDPMVRLLLRDRDHVYSSVEVDPTRLDQSEPHRRSRGRCRRGGGGHGLFSAFPSDLSFGGRATPVVRVSFIPRGRMVESLRGAGRPRNGFPGLARRLGRVERSIQGRQLGVGDRLSGPRHPFETGRPVFPGADRCAASGRVLLGLR